MEEVVIITIIRIRIPIKNTKKGGKKLKIPHHTSTTAAYNSNLPYYNSNLPYYRDNLPWIIATYPYSQH